LVTTFPLRNPASLVSAITASPDGSLWFTQTNPAAIGRITPSGSITEIPLPTDSIPRDIALGPDGNLWLTDGGRHSIDRITPAGTITEFIVPGGAVPKQIVSGPDGNLWFTELNQARLVRLTIAGRFTEVEVGDVHPEQLTVGFDGRLWITDTQSNRIARMTTRGDLTVFELHVGVDGQTRATSLTSGPDGRIWFTEEADRSRIGNITAGGVISEVALSVGRQATAITTRNSLLWIAEVNAVGVIIPETGAVLEFSVSINISTRITADPDGNLWIASKNRIHRLALDEFSHVPLINATFVNAVALSLDAAQFSLHIFEAKLTGVSNSGTGAPPPIFVPSTFPTAAFINGIILSIRPEDSTANAIFGYVSLRAPEFENPRDSLSGVPSGLVTAAVKSSLPKGGTSLNSDAILIDRPTRRAPLAPLPVPGTTQLATPETSLVTSGSSQAEVEPAAGARPTDHGRRRALAVAASSAEPRDRLPSHLTAETVDVELLHALGLSEDLFADLADSASRPLRGFFDGVTAPASAVDTPDRQALLAIANDILTADSGKAAGGHRSQRRWTSYLLRAAAVRVLSQTALRCSINSSMDRPRTPTR
jgi:virginiamycin B lyase